jgi:hypothetical protein
MCSHCIEENRDFLTRCHWCGKLRVSTWHR